MANVKDYKVTNLEGNKFQVQEQLTNGRFGKSVKVTIPQELLDGKGFNETVELVKMRVKEGRSMQKDRASIQKANNQDPELVEVFDEDELLEMLKPSPIMEQFKRYIPYVAGAMMLIGGIFLVATLSPTQAADAAPDPEPVVELNKYEKIQEQINSIEGKRISELQYIEDMRTIKANAIEMHQSKIASYNDDINAGKDRITNLDAEIAKLKKQQVMEATIVND